MAFHSFILEDTVGRASKGARALPPCTPIDRSIEEEEEEEEDEEEEEEGEGEV